MVIYPKSLSCRARMRPWSLECLHIPTHALRVGTRCIHYHLSPQGAWNELCPEGMTLAWGLKTRWRGGSGLQHRGLPGVPWGGHCPCSEVALWR